MENVSCAFITFRSSANPLFSDAEKVALEWTEALTKMGPKGVSDALYERARAHFSEVQLSEFSFAVGVINLWNRLNNGFRNASGSADEMLSNEVRIEITDSVRRPLDALHRQTSDRK